MANVCMILGKSGTGKSTSIKSLNPKETLVINILQKRLPFKGSSTIYSKENKNLIQISNYQDVIQVLNTVEKENPSIKNIVIDDAIFIMSKEFFSRAKEIGYGKFTELAQHFQQVIAACESMKNSYNIFLLLHAEDVKSDNIIVSYKVRTIGKLLDDQYNPFEVVPMVLFSDVKFDEKGKPAYGFYTHTTIEGGTKIPAKSPDGMFEEDWIDNNLQLVVDKMNKFYNE